VRTSSDDRGCRLDVDHLDGSVEVVAHGGEARSSARAGVFVEDGTTIETAGVSVSAA
jgi:hypothetical protein